MTRYEPVVSEGSLALVGDDDRLEVGTVDDVVAAIGGETYTVEYDEMQRTQPWLDSDDGALEVEVRDAVTTLPHLPETVAELREVGMGTDRYGLPERTVEFADHVVDILEAQGQS
jgi:hypothetical protein